MTTLDQLDPGARGTIQGYETNDPPPRLMEMGLVPGTPVEVVRRAPLGDPIYLKVRGYHLSVREDDAAQISVEAAAP
jgi:Fe2+ transport system protein FeoA